ncbi:uncharacterized protein TNCV_1740691 [Trichonephila clavipes]|uniref:Uncharacterized protein n=1 Tax=Trichonephila clavipes TaxID=2585209 RepID=A0A8X6RGJ0_TRICX|nr:uncharacterized protein TNCV_1740691 [Trichonephila clavipes]
MNIDRDGRTYRNCDNYSDTDKTSAHIFNCPALLVAVQEIGVQFSSTNLYADNSEQTARTVIWVHGTIWFDPIMNMTSSSSIKHSWCIPALLKLWGMPPGGA